MEGNALLGGECGREERAASGDARFAVDQKRAVSPDEAPSRVRRCFEGTPLGLVAVDEGW